MLDGQESYNLTHIDILDESQTPLIVQSVSCQSAPLNLDESYGKHLETGTPCQRREETKHHQNTDEKKMLVIAVVLKVSILFLSVGIGFVVYFKRRAMKEGLQQFLGFMERLEFWSPLFLCFIYIILISVFIPLELLLLSAGFLLTRHTTFDFNVGFPLAAICCFVSMIFSCTINFFVCRLWLMELTNLIFHRYRFFRAFSRAVKDGGAKFVALIRLTPIVPFAMSNCLFGVTSINFSQVLLGNLFTLPLITLTTYLGSRLGDLDQLINSDWEWNGHTIWIVILGGAATVAAVSYITHLTRRELALSGDDEDFDAITKTRKFPSDNLRTDSDTHWTSVVTDNNVVPD